MAKKPHADFPLRREPRALTNTLRIDPVVRRALEIAKRRFSAYEGVTGFGIGRAFRESKGTYASETEAGRRMVVKVCVARKKKFKSRGAAAGAQRIPKWVVVPASGKRGARRVRLDVVAVGQGKLGSATPHGWPTAGAVVPGRIFVFGHTPSNDVTGELASDQVDIGTTGAMITVPSGETYGIAAAHVFTNYCAGHTNMPSVGHPLGTMGKQWRRINAAAIYPPSVTDGTVVMDAAAFPVPKQLLPGVVAWPSNFKRRLATSHEIHEALSASGKTGFVWVERDGFSERVPIDLAEELKHLDVTIACGNLAGFTFARCWRSRFTSADTTQSGDSGAGVYLDTADGCALLGFHFMEVADQTCYAIDAGEFFAKVLQGEPGVDFQFA
ncbi:MAG: hypothetical protein ACOYN0_12755 [Phycisphaerales bacterium]